MVHLPRRDFVCPSCNGALYLGSFWILFSSLLAFSSPFLFFFFFFLFYSASLLAEHDALDGAQGRKWIHVAKSN